MFKEGEIMVDRIRVVHPEGGEVMTKQADAALSDINGLVSRYTAAGVIPPPGSMTYGDFSSGADFLDCYLRVAEMEEQFRSLPTRVRKVCENNPARFLEMTETPEGVAELVKLGLLKEQIPNATGTVSETSEAESSSEAKADAAWASVEKARKAP